ncbi:MAG: hypothetical protein Q8L87_15425 [Anaerolineales bacterium]|nr:hypothetical protein [Anaerolineales bacterium]
MAKRTYKVRRFNAASRATIEQVNAILGEYELQGYDLSVRQLFYQMVSRDLLPNSQKEYKRLGELVNAARLAGLVDWDMIRDRGRTTEGNSHFKDPSHILNIAASQFAIDKWLDQKYHVEVMVEKQALEGVLLPVCQELDINFTANKGYSSVSAFYERGRHFGRLNKQIVVLYLGDHDPSGLDMTRDVSERLSMFAECEVKVERLALNYPQVETLKPPPNMTKETDTRAAAYMAKYKASWELDAVEPATLAQVVRDAVLKYRDADKWQNAVMAEKRMKAELQEFADSYGGDA